MKKKILLGILAVCFVGLGTSCDFQSILNGENSSSVSNENVYEVSVPICSVGGQIKFDKDKIQRGDNLTITVIPEENYRLYRLQVNGKDVAGRVVDGKFVVSSVKNDIEIKALFQPIGKVNLEDQINYVSEANAPILDGEVDSVWDNASKLFVQNINETNGEYFENTSWIKVLWSENGLYFLGYIYDQEVVSMDTCNIWVNEQYLYADSTDESMISYSDEVEDGNYAICMNPEGKNHYYSGINIEEYWDENSTAKKTDFGYIVEVFVPCLSVESFYKGMEIGLDISIDYYSKVNASSIDDDRDAYTNWYGQGWYWSNIGALKKNDISKGGRMRQSKIS